MNNTFSLQQISRTGNLDSNLISRQINLNLIAGFMRLKYENLKLKQSQIENHLGYSNSTLQRHRCYLNILSPYRIQPNSTNKRAKTPLNTNFDKNSHREPDVKTPQMTLKQLKQIQDHIGKTKVF